MVGLDEIFLLNLVGCLWCFVRVFDQKEILERRVNVKRRPPHKLSRLSALYAPSNQYSQTEKPTTQIHTLSCTIIKQTARTNYKVHTNALISHPTSHRVNLYFSCSRPLAQFAPFHSSLIPNIFPLYKSYICLSFYSSVSFACGAGASDKQ